MQRSFGTLFVFGVNLLLLIEALFVLLLRVFLGLLSTHQSTIEDTTIVADFVDVAVSNRLLVGHHLLQQLLLVHQLQGDCLLLLVVFSVRFDQVVQHLADLFCNEGNAPLKYVHKVGKHVWVLVLEELLNIKSVVLSHNTFTLNLMTAPLLL